ncbi:MAG: type II toxin-antitoxin system VapB family antitoxin [Methylococcales bacterium]|nr:type II toxin-antitoxin system VapB family antitoxin [Methylococcales bacterium]
MSIMIAVEDSLINEALAIGHFETKEDIVVTALREFINRHKQQKITTLFGTLDPDADYDYKSGRKS